MEEWIENSRTGAAIRGEHPYAKAEQSFKYIYCFGLGVMAMGHMKAITEVRDYFEEMLEEIRLPLKQREQIIVDINNFLDFRLTEVLQRVQRKEERYCFVLDLYRIYNLSLWSQEYCAQILENYLQLFHFSEEEKQFFEEFNEAAKKADIPAGIRAYERFTEAGYEIRYSCMVYFFPGFYQEQRYEDLIVEAGKTVILDHPTVITGNVQVERGGSLLLYGADLRMQGFIRVQGGRLRLKEARVQIEQCTEPFWLQLKDTAVVQIEDTEIDCGLKCGMMQQDAGRLILSDSRILRTAGERMIRFSGVSASLKNCQLHHGQNGLLEVLGAARMCIENCSFAAGEADYGGAVYSESVGNVRMENCRFEFCRASYLGAAVYFKYEKFGQLVRDCICYHCEPEEDQIFHVYEDDFEIKIR